MTSDVLLSPSVSSRSPVRADETLGRYRQAVGLAEHTVESSTGAESTGSFSLDVDSDSELPVSSGDVVGRYTLERCLGKGGMGVVYQASSRDSEPPVALKFLKPSLAAHRGFFDRFIEEGRMTAEAGSPNVVRVLETGALPSGLPYIVTELLEGVDLEVLLDRDGPVGPERAVDFTLQACAALSAAHAVGIVHCDVKPENLVLATSKSRRPSVKLVDFGIARRMSASAPSGEDESLGSPSYMSPEQMTPGAQVDARTDVWALGIVLYRLVSDQLPFEGKSLVRLSRSVRDSEPPPLAQYVPDIDPFLQAIVSRCLEKCPAKRYASIEALARDLELWKAVRAAACAALALAGAMSPRSIAIRWRRGGLRFAVALAVALAFSAAGFLTAEFRLGSPRAAATLLGPRAQP